MATHSNILAWEIPLTEVPSGLHSMGSQRVKHNLAAKPPTTIFSNLNSSGYIYFLQIYFFFLKFAWQFL